MQEQTAVSAERAILLADMGGTSTRCAVLPGHGAPVAVQVLENRQFEGPGALLSHYLDSLDTLPRPHHGVIAVAAPVHDEAVEMLNIDWQFSRASLASQTGLKALALINDFTALAWALPVLEPEDLEQVGPGRRQPGQPRVVLGPGTGLGIATLIEDQGRPVVISGEGGHSTLPAADEAEARVIAFARERHGHCSVERLVSGPGLILIHEALHGITDLSPVAIANAADAGDSEAGESLAMLFSLLGTVAGNLALTLGALGGVYIGGGIIPRHLPRFSESDFRARFETKGRSSAWLHRIPTLVITTPHPALTGLAHYARSGSEFIRD